MRCRLHNLSIAATMTRGDIILRDDPCLKICNGVIQSTTRRGPWRGCRSAVIWGFLFELSADGCRAVFHRRCQITPRRGTDLCRSMPNPTSPATSRLGQQVFEVVPKVGSYKVRRLEQQSRRPARTSNTCFWRSKPGGEGLLQVRLHTSSARPLVVTLAAVE